MPLDKGVHLKCAHTEGRGAIAYAPDGRHIVTCGEDTFVKIFEAEELSAEPRTLEIHDAPVTALAMDRKGARVVTGTDAHIASVFSYPSGEGMRMLTRMQSAVRCIALDPKGRIAAVGAEAPVTRPPGRNRAHCWFETQAGGRRVCSNVASVTFLWRRCTT